MMIIIKKILKIQFGLILYFTINTYSYASEMISWLDFPSDNLQQILHKYDPRLDRLNSLIQSYNIITKSDWKKVPARIRSLEIISNYALVLQKQLNEKSLKQIAIKFSDIATAKSNYLKRLYSLYESEYQNRYYEIYNASKMPNQYIPLVIYSGRKYNYNTQELWGDYLIEAIDPCHRRLLSRPYIIWQQKHNHKKTLDFFLWLEEQDVSLFVPSIKIYDVEELKHHRVLIKNGKFYSDRDKLFISTYKGKPYNESYNGITFNKEHIFIIDSEENIYICYNSANTNHVSMSNYKPVIGSGKMILDNGKVKLLSFDSGHYLPTKTHVIQTIKFFENLGVHFKNSVRLEYYEDYEKISIDFKKYRELLKIGKL